MESSNREISRRAAHEKSRGGCVTCKVRHLKCDEEKPACKRCRATGRVCEGFVVPQPANRQRKQTSFRKFQNVLFDSPSSCAVDGSKNNFLCAMPPSGPLMQPMSPTEGLAYRYFVVCTLPLLRRLQPARSWTSKLFCAQESHPALRHCCLAISSIHAKLAQSASPSVVARHHKSTSAAAEPFALQQYTKALRALRLAINSNQLDPLVIRIAFILFVIYESLQGHRREMLIHLRNGLLFTQERFGKPSSNDGTEQSLSSLAFSCALYGRPRLALSPEVQRLHSSNINAKLPLPADLVSTREGLRIITDSVLHFVHKLDIGSFPDDISAIFAQKELESSLLQWRSNLKHLANQASGYAKAEALHYDLIRAQYEMTYVYLKAYITGLETAYDAYLPNFEKIVAHIDSALKQYYAEQDVSLLIFSHGLGIVSVLWSTAIRCRNGVLRRKALDLLSRAPQREVVWDAKVTAKAAIAVVEFEEQSIDETQATIQEESRAVHVDILDADETENAHIVIAFRPDNNSRDFQYKTIYI